MVEKAREKRAKGRRVEVSNRKLRVKDRRWNWDEIKRC